MRIRTAPALTAALLLGCGCAITDYELIVDNDQVRNGQGSGVVNTNGKAAIQRKSLFIAKWPDGGDAFYWHVDQAANGDRTLSTYSAFTTSDEFAFWQGLYCSPERQGCAIVTAADPEVPEDDPYDYRFNPGCEGARSLYYLSATTRYYGECGRALPLTDRLSLLNQGRLVRERGVAGLQWTATPLNASLTLDNLAGATEIVPLAGSVRLTMLGNGRRTTIADLSNPLLRVPFHDTADFLDAVGGRVNEVTFTFNGIEVRKRFARTEEPNSLRDLANRSY
ncbi:MAG TPA: hypothetical protein VF139_07475 [Candidatus Polarisedimenticolaceae bacterium]